MFQILSRHWKEISVKLGNANLKQAERNQLKSIFMLRASRNLEKKFNKLFSLFNFLVKGFATLQDQKLTQL